MLYTGENPDLRAISLEIFKIFILDINLKMTYLRIQPYSPGANELTVGLSRVTDYPWAVRFSEVTGYKFTNRLTGNCTDDLLETWSCQNHEKVEETPINPSCKWAKMHLLSVLGS